MMYRVVHSILIVILMTPGAFVPAYTGQITEAQTSGAGTALKIKICWTSSETAPTTTNASAKAVEVDNPPIDPDDDLGQSTGVSAITEPVPQGDGTTCQWFWFTFPNRDCEQGDEEFSAQVIIGSSQSFPANGAGGRPYSQNIC